MNQVVSKKRVADHGEVYTREREVKAMLDLVKQETERMESRFLEPACGTGNFLLEVLDRKLRVVESRYKKSQLEYERYAVIAVSSIYGIDILDDNIEDCRNRLFYLFDQQYSGLFQRKAKAECRRAVKYILKCNIIHGDALSLTTVSEPSAPIIFSEWSLVKRSLSKRKQIQEKLIKFATRVPVFMYLTDYRERCLRDVITQLEPGLFKKVTGLSVKDFELLVSLGVFNSTLMNDAIYKFKRYEDASLVYAGVDKHEGEDIGLYDTVLSPEDYHIFESEEDDL